MIITFKILPNEKKNEWLGWFGDNLIKVRLKTSDGNVVSDFQNLLTNDLGILPESMKLVKKDNAFLTYEMPDVAWELFLSAIES